MASLGELAGLDLPLINGFLAIGGAITGSDFKATGRTLSRLGLDGLSRDELAAFLQSGFAA
jgi:opine dehydrogenase